MTTTRYFDAAGLPCPGDVIRHAGREFVVLAPGYCHAIVDSEVDDQPGSLRLNLGAIETVHDSAAVHDRRRAAAAAALDHDGGLL